MSTHLSHVPIPLASSCCHVCTRVSPRFGPYVQHHALYVQLPKEGPGPLDVDLATALGLIQAKVDKAQARGRDPYQVRRAGM